jgi:hypothetical protein
MPRCLAGEHESAVAKLAEIKDELEVDSALTEIAFIRKLNGPGGDRAEGIGQSEALRVSSTVI